MKKGIRNFLGIGAVTGLVLAGCGGKNVYQPPPPPAVTVSRPVVQSVTDYLDLTGNTQAIYTVQLRARVEGYLEKILFNDGDPVKKGQLLFVIQQNTYQARLQQATANIMAQQATLQHAEIEYARYSSLVKQRAASQTDVDQWRYQRDSAQAGVLSAQAARDLARLDLDYTRVTAPFDGRMDRHLVDAGNLVGAGQSTLLAAINQIDPIYVYFTVNERDLLHMMGHTRTSLSETQSKNVPVYAGLVTETGYPHEGRLDFAAISVSPTTGTLLLRGILPNPDGRIIPGLYARVRIPFATERSALLVPDAALGFDQQGEYVLVVGDHDVVQRRGVTPGAQIEGFCVIEKGLRSTDRVVIEGLLRAVPGRPVTPELRPVRGPATRPAPAASGPTSRQGSTRQ
jgi:RND family efflux transporter MFP subunit